ncbi:hypothetical protein A0H76_2361 [Hepatospora eriocheir]|uniref:Uncharacterized protein n=1 Tax=Hepatospora eriocheir TaxID=1081669 RepID=A0A1X0QJX1_9MICR|nr:hypothetical protein A0H76_2361 [Hepatospora eriocheir]
MIIESKNKLNLLDFIGSLALLEFNRLTKIENDIKNSKNDNNQEDLKENFQFINEMNDIEVSNYFYQLKEYDLLSNPNNVLNQFKELLIKECFSDNLLIRKLANISLCKWMLVSQRTFHKYYKDVYLVNLTNVDNGPEIRNALIIFLHDFTLYYNPYINYKEIFNFLIDKDLKKNTILIIYNLLNKNIIRVNGNGSLLSSQLNDDKIGVIVRTILKTVSKNLNMISVIFYESFIDENISNEILKYLCGLIPQSVRGSLFLKCIKNNTVCDERKKLILDEFNLKEKFVSDNKHLLNKFLQN